MSSPPKTKKVPGWRQPWDTWRVLMFGGSIVLLAITIAQGLGELPRWFELFAQFVGYALLIVGFGLAMKLRRDLRENPKKEVLKKKEGAEEVSPRDPG